MEDTCSEEQLENLRKSAEILGVSVGDLLRLKAPSAISPLYYGEYDSGTFPAAAIHQDQNSILGGMASSVLPPAPELSTGFSISEPGLPMGSASTATTTVDVPNMLAFGSLPTSSQLGWHDCDIGIFEYFNLLDAEPPLGHRPSLSGSEEDDFVHLTPGWSGESAETNASTESSEPTEDSESESKGDTAFASSKLTKSTGDSSGPPRRFHFLAPKHGGKGAGVQYHSSSEDSTGRPALGKRPSGVKKKRSSFNDYRKRNETSLTRQLNACVRCRIQRNRVPAA